jgi:hypothetical protein
VPGGATYARPSRDTPRAVSKQNARPPPGRMIRNAGRSGGGPIRLLVADKEARNPIDRPAIEKIQYHSGGWLSQSLTWQYFGTAPLG